MTRTAEIEIEMVTTYDQDAQPLDYLFQDPQYRKEDHARMAVGGRTGYAGSASAAPFRWCAANRLVFLLYQKGRDFRAPATGVEARPAHIANDTATLSARPAARTAHSTQPRLKRNPRLSIPRHTAESPANCRI